MNGKLHRKTIGGQVKKFKFKKIDAFASGLSAGNPAAAVYLDDFEDITEQEMQRIAKELKGFVSEVGYIAQTGPDRYKLRYFSSEKEVEFCGHATIATMYDLLKSTDGASGGGNVLLETNKGVLDVDSPTASEDSIFITAPVPQYTDCRISPEEICAALEVRVERIDPDIPSGIVNAGTETLCVPVRSLDDIVRLSPVYQTLRAFCTKHGLDVITVFTSEVAGKARAYRTRVFAAPFGYLEDPATGSGNAALRYHLLRHGIWRGERIILEQNDDKQNPNIIKMAAKAGSGGSHRVIFGGSAITRIEGYYRIEDHVSRTEAPA
jgi:PhzF family phenazine biosynthesis protein